MNSGNNTPRSGPRRTGTRWPLVVPERVKPAPVPEPAVILVDLREWGEWRRGRVLECQGFDREGRVCWIERVKL